jgi:thioredoxin reductase (NADPH)
MSIVPEQIDCIIVGAGPAGLTAAIYLTRFRRNIMVFDAGHSRAAAIPLTHNYPGFPDGISGKDLLARMHAQAARYGARVTCAKVDRLEKRLDGNFACFYGDEVALGATVLLATGTLDRQPRIPELEEAIRRGYVRHCPICDGYEAHGKKVVMLAGGTKTLSEALFIRHFAEDLTVIAASADDLSDQDRETLRRADIKVIDDPMVEARVDGSDIVAQCERGEARRFDTLYSMLGGSPRSELARHLGADCDDTGNLVVDAHLHTSISGLYAAGDVVSSLSQISVATGQAAIAATAIHNSL